MQNFHPREERKNQAVLDIFAKLEAPKDPKPAAPATKKLRLEFSSGDADTVQTALEDHVFDRVKAPITTYGAIFFTDVDDGHDNMCRICGDVGELIICDKPGCTFSFHLKCAGLHEVPEGDWFCKYCALNPIDPNDGHHIYCVECGKEGSLIMCDAENCPRSFHFSCVGVSGDVLPTEDWFCPHHPTEHPSGVLLRLLSWELELRQVAVSSALVQRKLQVLVGGLSRQEQSHIVHLMKSNAYDPFAPRSTDYYLKQLLEDTDVRLSSAAPASALLAAPPQPVLQQQIQFLDLTQYRSKVGSHVSVHVVGSTHGIVYGSSIYSDDSDMNTAAVHAGVVREGEAKQVTVITKGPQKSFMGTSKHGVKTLRFSAWAGSFSFVY